MQSLYPGTSARATARSYPPALVSRSQRHAYASNGSIHAQKSATCLTRRYKRKKQYGELGVSWGTLVGPVDKVRIIAEEAIHAGVKFLCKCLQSLSTATRVQDTDID